LIGIGSVSIVLTADDAANRRALVRPMYRDDRLG